MPGRLFQEQGSGEEGRGQMRGGAAVPSDQTGHVGGRSGPVTMVTERERERERASERERERAFRGGGPSLPGGRSTGPRCGPTPQRASPGSTGGCGPCRSALRDTSEDAVVRDTFWCPDTRKPWSSISIGGQTKRGSLLICIGEETHVEPIVID